MGGLGKGFLVYVSRSQGAIGRETQTDRRKLVPRPRIVYNVLMLGANIFHDLGDRGVGALVGLVVGGVITWLYGRWRRRVLRQQVLLGDARDTVVIQHHVLEQAPDATVLRIRVLGQQELQHVVPNGHLADVLLDRAFAVTPREALISMDGPEGSFLLEILTAFVCDRVANAPFDHDLYAMAPCCEPQELSEHQPITILLVSLEDLKLFENWSSCRKMMVEHGSDGARILTLMSLAKKFKWEQEQLARMRQAGAPTRYTETVYILDLALDRRIKPLAVKEVPWARFASVLKQWNLD